MPMRDHRRQLSPHKFVRDWSVVYLPTLDAQLDMLEHDWQTYAKLPEITSHYPPEKWTRARELTDGARAALQELAGLLAIDLKADPPTFDAPVPLWLLAGPRNPIRQRATSLRAKVHRDLAALSEIMESVSEADRYKAIEYQLDQEDSTS